MTKTYKTPEQFKTAIETRLKTLAAANGRSFVRERQLFVFDCFLHRLTLTLGDKMLLKGGYALELVLERARTTKDVDISADTDDETMLAALEKAAGLKLVDFLQFKVRPDAKRPALRGAGFRYEGKRHRVEAILANKPFADPFHLDVAFREPTHGKLQIRTGGEFLASFVDSEPYQITIYPAESHIAEKLHAYTLRRERENSRVRDLPDLALLASATQYQSSTVLDALKLTFEYRNTHQIPQALVAPPSSWTKTYAELAKEEDLHWTSLADVFDHAAKFLDPILSPLNRQRDRIWNPADWGWTG